MLLHRILLTLAFLSATLCAPHLSIPLSTDSQLSQNGSIPTILIQKRQGVQNAIMTDSIPVTSQISLDSLPLICPYGIQTGDNAKNILFIHGTGATGDLYWKGGLPDAFKPRGYSGCWVNLPITSLGDAQITSEYVMNSIKKLYFASGNTPIFLIGHSQGNLNIQWALNFFPSIRDMVVSYVSLSGDFQGTGEAQFGLPIEYLRSGGTGPSILQQSVVLGRQSNFLQALNKHGDMPLVPTTSIFGLNDQVIQPVILSTQLHQNGAPYTHISIQALCPLKYVDHFTIVIDRVAFFLALDAFESKSSANMLRVKLRPALCILPLAPDMSAFAFQNNVIEPFSQAMMALFKAPPLLETVRTNKEPELVPYAANQP